MKNYLLKPKSGATLGCPAPFDRAVWRMPATWSWPNPSGASKQGFFDDVFGCGFLLEEPQDGYDNDEECERTVLPSSGPYSTSPTFPCKSPCFEHENDGRRNFSVKLTRMFRRDEESEWESTEYLGPQDLLPAADFSAKRIEAIARSSGRGLSRTSGRRSGRNRVYSFRKR